MRRGQIVWQRNLETAYNRGDHYGIGSIIVICNVRTLKRFVEILIQRLFCSAVQDRWEKPRFQKCYIRILNITIMIMWNIVWIWKRCPGDLKGTQQFLRRWRQSHLEAILRQDVIDIGSVTDIRSLETLVALLRKRAGTQISYAKLARDLGKDPKTIKS